jgi:lipopolysaccharide export system protein LptC
MTLKAHLPGEPNEEPETFLGGPLGFLRPRVTKRLVSARGPRRVVGWLRLGLPIGAFVLLIALILWPAFDRNKITAVAIKSIPDFVIKNLHFTGLDSKNQPYSVSALKATRPGGLQNIYDLDKPEGEMTLTDGAWISGKAQYGRLDNDTKKLWLGGDVQLFHDKGYQFTTDEAQVDIDGNYAWGEKPVLIQGDFGTIRGKGFRLLNNGNVMVVGGPAKAILNLHTGGSSVK